MTALTTNLLVDAGTKPTYVNSSVSDTAEVGNGVNTFLHYKNTGGSISVVTVVVPGINSYAQPNPDPAISIAATTGEAWIPLRRAYDAGDGSGRVTVTATNSGATLQVAVVQIG